MATLMKNRAPPLGRGLQPRFLARLPTNNVAGSSKVGPAEHAHNEQPKTEWHPDDAIDCLHLIIPAAIRIALLVPTTSLQFEFMALVTSYRSTRSLPSIDQSLRRPGSRLRMVVRPWLPAALIGCVHVGATALVRFGSLGHRTDLL